jgi:hypothetical protein
MKNPKAIVLICIAILAGIFIHPFYARAQEQPVKGLKQVINTISTYNTILDPEKIFVQLDRPAYNSGDTLWFKASVFNASTLSTGSKSGLMYLELYDENNKLITRNMVPLYYGTGWGDIPLNDNAFPDGNYILRAYTNWTRNFDEHYMFTRSFTISSSLASNWLVNSQFKVTRFNGANNIEARLSFGHADDSPLIAEKLRTKVSAGTKTLYRTTLQTGIDGGADFSFNLPDHVDPKTLSIKLNQKGHGYDNVSLNVPVIINRAEKTDLQFMPESGALIGGMRNQVAFKAINEEGLGTDVSGVVFNSQQQQVATFKSLHLGMGKFNFTPKAGEVYSARIQINGKELSYNLPAVKSSGLSLHIENQISSDSLIVKITPTADMQEKRFYLIAQARGIICYGALFDSNSGASILNIAKALFPTGITRFTLLNMSCRAVAERIVYIDHHDAIHISVTPSRPAYANRDSVSLAISATDKNGRPVKGNFALSVTDNSQVKTDSSGTDNILCNLLLTDDLKGYVENPGWYFNGGDTTFKAAALDNLLLTQGWINYNWGDVFRQLKVPAWQPESQFTITGRVTNLFNKQVSGSHVTLLSTDPVLLLDTITNKNGQFLFRNLQPADNSSYALQARNKHGGDFNVILHLDEYKSPKFNPPAQRFIPWYVNMDTARLAAIHIQQYNDLQMSKLMHIRQLKEVEVRSSKIIRGSHNLLGPGASDFALDEKDIRQMGDARLGDILRKGVRGFIDYGDRFYLRNRRVSFIIDGFSDSEYVPVGMRYTDYIRQLLDDVNGADIRGIEVFESPEKEARYSSQYSKFQGGGFENPFIEITTYAGNGMIINSSPGLDIYRPIAFASQKQFYSPKYAHKQEDPLPDNRCTLFWTPNIFTDGNGRCSVSFYTSDQSGTYNICLQGADLRGRLGAVQSKIIVNTH